MAGVQQSVSDARDGATSLPKDEEAVIERARNSESGSDAAAEKLDSLDGVHAVEDELASNDVEAENSPIEEVRAAVPNTDDPDMPCSTFRAWFLGVLFVLLGSGVNIFFSLRYPRYRSLCCCGEEGLVLTMQQRADHLSGCTACELPVRVLFGEDTSHWTPQPGPPLQCQGSLNNTSTTH